MTVREFIKELESQASENGVLDENIASIGTGQTQDENFYVVRTENMSYGVACHNNEVDKWKQTQLKIVYWSDK